MNSPWKNLQSVNQPTYRLQRVSAGNSESLMLSVPLQPCNEISGQSDGIILMVFSWFLPQALTPLTDKAWLWKKISLSDGFTKTIWGWSIYTGLQGSSLKGSGVSRIRINLAVFSPLFYDICFLFNKKMSRISHYPLFILLGIQSLNCFLL